MPMRNAGTGPQAALTAAEAYAWRSRPAARKAKCIISRSISRLETEGSSRELALSVGPTPGNAQEAGGAVMKAFARNTSVNFSKRSLNIKRWTITVAIAMAHGLLHGQGASDWL